MELSTVIAALGLLLAGATFLAGRQSAGHSAGKERGALQTDIRYIRQSIDRIEARLTEDVRRLEGRIDALAQQAGQAERAALSAQQSAKSAHRRLDALGPLP